MRVPPDERGDEIPEHDECDHVKGREGEQHGSASLIESPRRNRDDRQQHTAQGGASRSAPVFAPAQDPFGTEGALGAQLPPRIGPCA